MRSCALAAALPAAALNFGGVTGISGPATTGPPGSGAVVNDAEWEFVLALAQRDERVLVRSMVWSALLSDDVAAGAQQFFESGSDYAESPFVVAGSAHKGIVSRAPARPRAADATDRHQQAVEVEHSWAQPTA